MKTNVLKKIEVGNPLINLGLMPLYDIYQAANTDQDLAGAYHKILDAVEDSSLAESFAYAMIAFSVSHDINPLIELVYED